MGAESADGSSRAVSRARRPSDGGAIPAAPPAGRPAFRGALEAAAVSLALVLLATFLFRDAVISGRVFFQRDVGLMWYTQMTTLVGAVTRGEWPLWNPWIGFGQPLWADANNEILYPFTWLNLLLRPWAYYTLFVVAHSVLAGAGLYLLARRLGLTRGSAVLSAALWMASGPLLSVAESWVQLAGAAWMPWAVLAGVSAAERGGWTWTVAWGLCQAAQILGGSPELALMTATTVLAYVLLMSPGRPAERLRRLAWTAALALGVAAGVSAGQWLPALEVASRSARASLPEVVRAFWSVHPANLLQLLVPVPLHELHLRPELRAALFEGREPFLPSIYLGMPTLAFASAAFIGRHRRLALFLAGCFLAETFLALGRHAPLYGLVVTLLPPLKALRYPVKALVGTSFCWALLAGCGVDTWAERERSRRRDWVLLVVTPLAAGATLAGTAAILLGARPEAWGSLFLADPGGGFLFRDLLGSTVAKLAVAALSAAAVVFLGLVRVTLTGRVRAAALAAALVAVGELVTNHDRLSPTAPRDLFTCRPPVLSVATPPDDGRLYVYDYYMAGKSERYLRRRIPYQVTRTNADWPLPAATALAMRLSLFPPTAGPWGIAGSYEHDTPGIAPLFVTQLYDLLLAAEDTPAHLRLLRVGAVARVVARHRAGFEPLTPLASMDVVMPEPLSVFEVPGTLPRCYAVDGVRVADGSQALSLLIDPGFDPTREIIVPAGSAVPANPAFRGSAHLVHLGIDRLTLEADLDAAGWVVLVDAYDPNWKAAVDGAETPVERANVSFRAVRVPAGHHVVNYVYRPASVRYGLAITSCTVLLLFLVALGRPLLRRRGARIRAR